MDISIHKDYLVIDGKPRFLYGGDFSYGRAPRRSWRDRVLKMKAAGMNCVTFYCVWLFHEPERGQWDFEGGHDLGAFIDLIAEAGMFAVCRLGPFVHGEYRNGGLPQWLVDDLGPRARTNDPEYLGLADAWYRGLAEIVRPRLATNGGPIILLQLENELGSAGCKGDDLPRGSADPKENVQHVLHFHRLARELGMDGVPIIDINHIPDKATLIPNLVDAGGGYPVNCFGSDGDLGPFTAKWWESHERPRITIERPAAACSRASTTRPPYRNTNGFQGPLVPFGHRRGVRPAEHRRGRQRRERLRLPRRAAPRPTWREHAARAGHELPGASDRGRKPPGILQGIEADRLVRAGLRAGAAPRSSAGGLGQGGLLRRAAPRSRARRRPLRELRRRERNPRPSGAREADRVAGAGDHRLNLSESNFLFMRNVSSAGTLWRRDVRVAVSSSRLACEVNQEYPKRVQMELPPQTCKIMPFFVRLAPKTFLEYSTATLLDRRPFGSGVQVVAHATGDETVETRFVVKAKGPVRCSANLMAMWESPNAVTILGRPGDDLAVAEIDGPEPIRYVLMTQSLAGEAWDLAAPGGPCVAASSLRVLDSHCEGGSTSARVEAEAGQFHLHILSPRQPLAVEGSGLSGVSLESDGEAGLCRVSGRIGRSAPEIDFSAKLGGGKLVYEAKVDPGILASLHDLALRCDYDGSYGKAFLDDELISDHPYGKHLFWEVCLRDWLVKRSRLRLEFEGARQADVRLVPIVQTELKVRWA